MSRVSRKDIHSLVTYEPGWLETTEEVLMRRGYRRLSDWRKLEMGTYACTDLSKCRQLDLTAPELDPVPIEPPQVVLWVNNALDWTMSVWAIKVTELLEQGVHEEDPRIQEIVDEIHASLEPSQSTLWSLLPA